LRDRASILTVTMFSARLRGSAQDEGSARAGGSVRLAASLGRSLRQARLSFARRIEWMGAHIAIEFFLGRAVVILLL